MTAWAGVDLAVIRGAAEDTLNKPLRITLTRAFGGRDMLAYVESEDAHAARRKPVRVLPGPLVSDSHATLLRAIADVLDGTVESLVVTDPRDGTAK